MKVKSVLYDLDDTLIKSSKIYDKALEFATRFLSEKYKLNHEDFFKLVQTKHLIVHKNFPTVHTRHSRILVFRMALDEVLDNYDLSLLPDVEDMYWDYFFNNIDIYPNVIKTLKTLRDRKIKIAIVSDGSLSLRIRKVKAAKLLEYVDELVASEEVIFEKPFSAIFTLALSQLKCDPAHAVMVGNDYKNDIRGAQLVGMKAGTYEPPVDASVYNNNEDIIPDFKLKDHQEILDIIE
ncbi:HAD family hydrolase [Candidatus Dojkabacteria bacterium]|nr:HAD family hydrolase [Candidatus Dojkabacteria bacterium]